MTKRRYRQTIVIFLFSIFASLSQIRAAEPSVQEIPFQGLKNIGILIEDLSPHEKRLTGLSEKELKEFVELKLRQNKIPIRNNISDSNSTEKAYVYVSVQLAYVEEIDHFVYSISVNLNQMVRLLGNDRLDIAKTWDEMRLGIISTRNTRTTIKSEVDSLLTSFMNKYLSANQKDISPEK